MTDTTETTPTFEEIEPSNRRSTKRANTTDFHTSGSEKIILGPICVKGLEVINLFYRNKSAANAHTVKVYEAPSLAMPTTMEDGVWKQIYTESVAANTDADPWVFKNGYEWIMVTSNGTAEADIADCYFIGTHQ